MTHPQRPEPPDRDPALDTAWKAHSTELPPQHVDAAILAAAHRETRTRPHAVGDDDGIAHARGPSRAWWGLAAAATIGAIAFGVLQLAPPLQPDPSSTVATDLPRAVPEIAPQPPASRDVPSPLAEAPRSPGTDAPVALRENDRTTALTRTPDPAPGAAPSANAGKPAEPRRRRTDAPSASFATAPPPSAPPEPAAPAELAKAEAARSADDAKRPESGERTPAAAPMQPSAQPPGAQADGAAQEAAAAPVAKLQARAPAAWIERIRMLHAQQRFDDAARELNAFRDAYADADAQLPVELRAWAASIKRD